jgi:septation ring formation regulator EzrA
MSKILILIIFSMFLTAGYAQQKVFRSPRSGDEAFRMMVVRNDTVIIELDSAYIYSMAMTGKIRELEQLYLSCLSMRDDELKQITTMLAGIQDSYDNVNSLISRSSNLNSEQLGNFQDQVKHIVDNLNHDIVSLRQVEMDLTNAQDELKNVKKEIKKERSRLWWRKTGSIFLAAIAGFAAGFIVASAG